MHKTQIKNVKAVAMQEAVEYVKKKGNAVADLLTREQHKMVKQFLEFKQRTLFPLDTLKEYKAEMCTAESAYSLNCPVNEVMHGFGAELKLYDSLIPAMRMHNKSYGTKSNTEANDILF